MFVADLDRPWVDTPFLLQGFLIEDQEHIVALRTHCEFVIVDRSRSIGDEYEGPPKAAPRLVPRATSGATVKPLVPAAAGAHTGNGSQPEPAAASRPQGPEDKRVVRLEDVLARRTAARNTDPVAAPPNAQGSGEYPGLLGNVLDRLRGFWARDSRHSPSGPVYAPAPEAVEETREEFEARASLLPPGIVVQTYRNEVPVEVEVERARQVFERSDQMLDKLVADIRTGNLMQIESVDEVVNDMVESIVRNPDALMWVARLREQDITTYGHGLQVAVYLTAFGRQLGFPKPQLALLGQIGLLLDIGKIRLSRELLEKQARLSPEEFTAVKQHVTHSVDILSATPHFHPEVIEGIAQHHERVNGSGYPQALRGESISLFGRMAGIADCFAAITKRRPYAEAVSSYEAMRSLTGWGGEFFHEALVQQFIASVGVFPVGSLIELSTGEVAIVVAHNKVRRLKPKVLVVTGPDKSPAGFPSLLDLLYDPKSSDDSPIYIRRGLAAGAFGLDLKDFYLA